MKSLIKSIKGKDKCSHYPFQMVAKKFPMARGTFIGDSTPDFIEWAIENDWCCLFTVRFKDLDSKFLYDSYISSSHCQILSKDAIINNGRVASASDLQITITDRDWLIIKRVYEWDADSIEIHALRIYPAGYLPRPFILAVLNLYKNKTTLKGIPEKIVEYMVSKNMLNASYGMAVTSIIRDIFEYSNTAGWSTQQGNTSDQLNSYNSNYNRFLFYAWGVWVTAWARYELWDAILALGQDYIYSDTDSVKYINDHEAYFIDYNLKIIYELRKVCNYYSIPWEMVAPKTKKGETKILGVWEDDADYLMFKTDGAKRYIYTYINGESTFTVSGVNKKFGMPYLLSTYCKIDYETARIAYNPTKEESDNKLDKEAMSKITSKFFESENKLYDRMFDEFHEGLYFPPQYTGKSTLTYRDEPICDVLEDYQGNKAPVFEYSFIHMEPQSYMMSISDDFMRYLEGYRDASI